jgi:ABC-type sugar transport system substrate-binding protein
MMRRKSAMLLATLLAASTIAGFCADRKALYAPFGDIPVPKRQYRIGVILKTFVNDYFIDLRNGFQDAADKYGVTVDFFASPGENDLLIQKQIMEDMLARKYDLICVNPITPTNLLEPCAKATKMGIPLINTNDACISKESQDKFKINVLSFISTDWNSQLRWHVRYLAQKLGPSGGEVLEIMGFHGSTAAIWRHEGFIEEMKKYPQLKLVATLPGDWDRKKSMDITADVLQAHPNLKGISASNDNMALGAIQALKNAGKLDQVAVLGCDAIPDAIMGIKSNELDGTVAFMQYENGFVSIEAAILYLEGMKKKIPATIFANQELWTADNIDQKIAKFSTYYSGLKNLGK